MTEQLSIFDAPIETLEQRRALSERIAKVATAAWSGTGRQLGEAGMAKTLEAEREEWIATALQALDRFSRLIGYEEFKTEDFRWWCASNRMPPPHNHHVWGALTNRACKDGIIRFTGKFAPSASPKTHGHNVKVWTRA